MYVDKPNIIQIYSEYFQEREGWAPPGVSLIAAGKMWTSTQGKNAVVAILDTGIDYNHPDLKDNVIGGVSFVTGEGDYMDFNGHGTHVAGTIAARGKLLGAAPDAKLLAVKVLDKNGMGAFNSILQGLNWARNWRGKQGEKVNIINMSLGGPLPNNALHDAVIKAYQDGITLVCAAGNAGDAKPDTSEIAYPAYYDEALSVGAVDLRTGIADFSNSNDQIDIVAPGVCTYSTYPSGRYVKLSGTSMAAPHISGAAALIYSHYFKQFGQYPSPAQVKLIMKYQAVDLGEAGFDNLYGFGLFTFNPAGGKAIRLVVGQRKYYVNGQEALLSTAPIMDKGVVLVSADEICGLLTTDMDFVSSDGSEQNSEGMLEIWV